jgi:hypothetical protein
MDNMEIGIKGNGSYHLTVTVNCLKPSAFSFLFSNFVEFHMYNSITYDVSICLIKSMWKESAKIWISQKEK